MLSLQNKRQIYYEYKMNILQLLVRSKISNLIKDILFKRLTNNG